MKVVLLMGLDKGGVMSERELVGEVTVDSGQITIVDPSHIESALELEKPFEVMSEDLLIISTQFGVRIKSDARESLDPINEKFPVYFEKDGVGGSGKSRIIIELVH